MPQSKGNFRNLVVWKRSLDLAVLVYRDTEALPKSETFGLQSQMRRAASSIAANIAEGSSRHHSTEFVQFIGIALGSLSELETYYELARRLGYLEGSSMFEKEATEIGRMLNGLRRRLQNSGSSTRSAEIEAGR